MMTDVILRELAAENYRAFEQAALRIPECGLLLVAGANNTGKSALLSAMDVIAGVSVDATDLRRVGSANPARVSATFELDEKERGALFPEKPGTGETAAHEFGRQLRFVFQEERNRGLPLVEVWGEWPGMGFQLFAATTILSETGYFVLKVIRSFRDGDTSHELALQLEDQTPAAWQEPVSLQSALRNVPIPPRPLTKAVEFMDSWPSRYYHFRALRPGTQRYSPLASASKLDPTGQNLAAVLLGLITNRPEIASELRRLISEIVPERGELRVRTDDGNMEVAFAVDGVGRNLKELGTGVEQLLMTLVVGLTEAPPFTLVIEEPETNLHHAAQRALLGLFKSWAADRQILVATHSPAILDWSPGGDRLWHVTRARGVSTVAPVREDPSALLDSLGVRLSDVLSATRVLIVEGPADEDTLNAWFPEIMRNPLVAVLRGRGGDNARHADLLAEWLTGVDRIGVRRVLYLRDRDELAPAALKKLQDTESVALLQRRELENYLLDASALVQVLGPLTPDGSAKPSASDIMDSMKDAAERLRRKVIINRVCRQVQPARPLMDHELRQRLASEAADQEAVTAAIIERLMTEHELREQIETAWQAAEADVAARSGDELLAISPGEEILEEVFTKFAGRGYSKRDHGVAIARAMAAPPEEIRQLLAVFMADDDEA